MCLSCVFCFRILIGNCWLTMVTDKRSKTAKKFRGNHKHLLPRNTQQRPQQAQFEASGANAEPIKSRLGRSQSEEEKNEVLDEQTPVGSALPGILAEHFSRVIEDSTSRSNGLSLPPPPPPPPPLDPLINQKNSADFIPGLSESVPDHNTGTKNAETVTFDHETVPGPQSEPGAGEPSSKELITMIANGAHPSYRHQQPHIHAQRDRRNHATDIVSPTNRGPNGPMPSHLQVAKPFVFQQAIEGCLQDLGVTQTREDNIRLAGIKWIDDTRRALKLYVLAYGCCCFRHVWRENLLTVHLQTCADVRHRSCILS